jgi:hypothetical protein
MAKGNGIESKGKTKGKNFGDSGSDIAIENSIKGPGGKTNESMLANGRSRSKLVAQFGSTGLKGKGK